MGQWTNCKIQSYCRTDPHQDEGAKAMLQVKPMSMRLRGLQQFLAVPLRQGDMVQAGQPKHTLFGKKVREVGDWGIITVGGSKPKVRWYGDKGKILASDSSDDASQSGEPVSKATKEIENFTNCYIMAFERRNGLDVRRRLAPRTPSKRRDSPVMLRLLEEVRAAAR